MIEKLEQLHAGQIQPLNGSTWSWLTTRVPIPTGSRRAVLMSWSPRAVCRQRIRCSRN